MSSVSFSSARRNGANLARTRRTSGKLCHLRSSAVSGGAFSGFSPACASAGASPPRRSDFSTAQMSSTSSSESDSKRSSWRCTAATCGFCCFCSPLRAMMRPAMMLVKAVVHATPSIMRQTPVMRPMSVLGTMSP